MLTAQEKLDQTLISWYDLLSSWAADGSLAATAEHVLDLDGENAIEGADDLLQSYTNQWSLGDFESLPPIVLLSNDDISGARGAYAASTDTIYLNEDWLLTATESDIIAVLTEELGAFLDDQLNTVDTQGDEGALFSAELLGVELTDAEKAAIQAEDDSVQIDVSQKILNAEASTITGPNSSLIGIGTDGHDSAQIVLALDDGSYLVIGESTKANQIGNSTFTEEQSPGGYAAKLTGDGQIEWVAAYTGDYTKFLGADKLSDGSGFIITGSFVGDSIEKVFGSDSLLETDGSTHIFAAKLNTLGEWEWAKEIGIIGSGFGGPSVSAMGDGSVLVGGSFSGSITIGDDELYGGFNEDGTPGRSSSFIANLDSLGNFKWGISAPSANSLVNDIDPLPGITGSSIAVGTYASGGIDIGGESFNTYLNTGYSSFPNSYIASVSDTGYWEWAVDFKGNGTTRLNAVDASLDIDSTKIIYTAGTLLGGVSFEGETGGMFAASTKTRNGVGDLIDTTDGLIVKLNQDGLAFWSALIETEGQVDVRDIKALADGSAIVVGGFVAGKYDFNLSKYITTPVYFGDIELTSTTTLNSSGDTIGLGQDDAFVARIDRNGEWLWATKAGGTLGDEAFSLDVIDQNTFAISGIFRGGTPEAVFGPAYFGTSEISSYSNTQDGYVALIDADGNWLATNSAPILTGEPAVLNDGNEDADYIILQSELLQGWTDGDGDLLSAQNLTAPDGTLIKNADKSWTFAPTENFNGEVELTYEISDGRVTTAASLQFTIEPVNDAPVAADLTLGTDEDTSFNGQVPTATDVDNSQFTYALASDLAPDSGSLVFNADGTFAFDPGAAFQDLNDGDTAQVSFTYTATDNNGAVSAPATVTITVDGITDFTTASISAESNLLLLSQDAESIANLESYTTERVNLNDGKGKPIWAEQTTYQPIEGGQNLAVDGIALATSAADTIISAQGDEATGRFALQKELAIYTQTGVDVVTGSSLGTLYDLGGVSTEGDFDTVNAVSGAKDVIQLGNNYDASTNGAGHIVINNLQAADGDTLMLQGDSSRYLVELTSSSTGNNKGGGKGKKPKSQATSFTIYSADLLADGSRDLIATVNSSSFTPDTLPDSFIEYQSTPLTSQEWLNSF